MPPAMPPDTPEALASTADVLRTAMVPVRLVQAVQDALQLPAGIVAQFAAVAKEAEDGGLSANTIRALKADLAIWRRWCRGAGEPSLPARPEAVTAFIRAQRPTEDGTATPRRGEKAPGPRRPATVHRYLASIAYLHRAAGLPDPTKTLLVQTARKGHAKAWQTHLMEAKLDTRQWQAPGLTRHAVGAILKTLGSSLIDCRDRALLLTARDLLARRSELVALRIEDITPASNGGAVITIRKSKSDQEAKGAERPVRPHTYRAIREWIVAAELAGTQGLLFRSVRQRPRRNMVGVKALLGASLHENRVSDVLKKLATRLGDDTAARLHLDAAHVSGHSARVGMAQDLVELGATLPEVIQAGRWSTDAMVARYAARALAENTVVMRLDTELERGM